MLFSREKTPVFHRRRGGLFAPVLFALLLVLLAAPPTASRRRFNLGNEFEPVAAIVDLDFSLTVAASKDGKTVQSVTLLDDDIQAAELPPGWYSGYQSITFYFNKQVGETSAASLNYFFVLHTCETCKIPEFSTMTPEFTFTPVKLFDNIPSKVKDIKFKVTNPPYVNTGDTKTSYLCNKTDQVSFQREEERGEGTDSYKYDVKLETGYFHVQPFRVVNGEFSKETPTLCEDVSPSTLSEVLRAGLSLSQLWSLC